MGAFKLRSDFSPKGDQEQAIEKLTRGVVDGTPHQVLLGVTGSGKTFTLANVIERVQKTTLVIVHNKTLAAQLYGEFKSFFPENAVNYFVSYYDYYQPEAYIPQSDTYIEKDSSINDAIDRMRHAATSALFERRDVIIVASVSCIYGLGSPEAYPAAAGRNIETRQVVGTVAEFAVGLHHDLENAPAVVEIVDVSRGQHQANGVVDVAQVEIHRLRLQPVDLQLNLRRILQLIGCCWVGSSTPRLSPG